MADPLADHENNTLTTLKLFEALKDHERLKRVVYASAGCTVAEKTFDGAEATQEDAPVSLWLDSPYQISKIVGEYYSNYYFARHGLPVVKARFQNVYGPGEVLGAGRWRGTVNTVWRNVTPTFIYKALKHEALPVENGGIASRDFIYVDDMAAGLIACATARRAGRRLQPRQRRRDDDPRARRADQRADRQPDPDRAHAGPRLGPLGPALRRPDEGARASSASRRRRRCARASSARSRGRARTSSWIDRCIARHADRMRAARSAAGNRCRRRPHDRLPGLLERPRRVRRRPLRQLRPRFERDGDIPDPAAQRRPARSRSFRPTASTTTGSRRTTWQSPSRSRTT